MALSSSPGDVRARAFEEMSDAMLIADDARRYVDVNGAACALLGKLREELLGMRVDDLFPSFGNAIDDTWRTFLEEGSMSGELTIDRPTTPVIVEFRARAHIAPNRHLSVLRDVTERVRATQAAEHRERAFRRLADHLPHVVARFDREHRHLYVNTAIVGATHDAPESMLGKTNAELGRSATDVRVWNELIDRAFAGEEVTTDYSFGGPENPRVFLAHLIPERGADGEVETVLSVALDVTNERQALAEQQRLRHDAEQAHAILDALVMAAPLGFAFLDSHLQFQTVNPALAAMNGLPVTAHIGRAPMDLFPRATADFVATAANSVFRTGEAQRDLEFVDESPAQPGLARTRVEQWYPVRVKGEIVGIGVVVEEITERRRAERALREAGDLRDRLMAIVSHDLRTPLNAVVMAATLIAASEDASRSIQSTAGRILKAGGRMNRLISQLMDFARIDHAGGLRLERASMDLRSALERAADECRMAFPDSVIEVDARGNTAGQWDEDRLLQVMTNLLSNALQHGDGHVRASIDADDPASVRVKIANGGIQIPPEMLPIIFDPFRRAGEGLTRRGGLGLGLFITRSIVEAHGGNVTVRSDADGTNFTIELPRQ